MTTEVPEESEWYRSWEFDQCGIEIRLVEDQTGNNVREVWRVDLLDEAPYSTETPFDTIGQLVAALRVEGGAPPPHVASVRQTYFSWGADSAAAQIVLEIAADALTGVMAAATYDALKHAVRRLVSQGQGRAEESREPLSRDESIERARWHLAAAFDLDHETTGQLELAGEEIRGDGSRLLRFVLCDRRFEVELLDEYGLVRVGRLGWSD